MKEWGKKQHTKTGLVNAVTQSTITVAQVDKELVQMISECGKHKEFVLCGNSIWQDRLFVKKYLPLTYAFLHYRMIDVSAIKQMVRAWYPKHPQAQYIKKDNHRAVDDVYESINELLHYRKYFFI
jgi:oligoribonuclease